jgi:hypothetical protein
VWERYEVSRCLGILVDEVIRQTDRQAAGVVGIGSLDIVDEKVARELLSGRNGVGRMGGGRERFTLDGRCRGL